MTVPATDRDFVKWQPALLMEWAKSGYSAGKYNLARSGIPAVLDLAALPGGPFVPEIYGHNELGHDGLRETLAAMYGTTAECILIAQGASQCNFLMAGAALSGGGTAIVETPFYEPVLRSVEVWADRIIRLPRRRENGFKPDPADLARLLTDDTRLVVLTNLHNPSHARLSATEMQALVDVAEKRGAVVVVDEVFLPMVERNHALHSQSVGAVSLCSLGKSFGLDGLRVGWAVGPKDLIHRAYRLNNLLGVNQPYMTEDLAWRILCCPQALEALIAGANRAAAGRDLFEEFLRETPQVKAFPPAGAISALVELPDGTNDQAFARQLMDRYETAVFPGSYFECPGCLRVSFGGPRDEVREGLNRLSLLVRESS